MGGKRTEGWGRDGAGQPFGIDWRLEFRFWLKRSNRLPQPKYPGRDRPFPEGGATATQRGGAGRVEDTEVMDTWLGMNWSYGRRLGDPHGGG